MATAKIMLLVVLGILGTLGVLGIQNDPTSLRSSRDEMVLSASAYTGPERTSSSGQYDESLSFQTSQPALQLESSKSIDIHAKDTNGFAFKVTGPDESFDVLTSSKHIDHIDGNNIEVKPGEYYRSIVPTRSDDLSGEGQGAPQRRDLLLEPRQPVGTYQDQRERHQDQTGRQGRQDTPRIYSDHAPPPIIQTAVAGNRQANPDIQDIITGIVKLLNGNVNIAANTVRPHRPVQPSRINNRGPPRDSDLPPLPPDFDTPGMNPPPPPDHPYPFEKPPARDRPSINQLPPERPVRPFMSGVPLPESIVPQGNRPWNRPYRPGTRRPIPPYKPLPPQESSFFDNASSDTEKPHHDEKPTGAPASSVETTVTSEDPQRETNYHTTDKKPIEQDETTTKPQKYQPHLKDDKVIGENTLILGSDPRPIPIPNHDSDEEDFQPRPESHNKNSARPGIPLESHFEFTRQTSHMPQEAPSKTLKTKDESKTVEREDESSSMDSQRTSSSTSSRTLTMTTLRIETSSSIQVIEPTRTIAEVKSTTLPTESDREKTSESPTTSSSVAPSLEPSRVVEENSETTKSSASTPTEGLPSSFTRTSSPVEKTIVNHPKPVATFSKNQGPSDRFPYRPRPGIVLDDTLDYTGGAGLSSQRPFAPPRHPQIGDIFDVTVSAIQGPGGGSGESVRVPVHVGGSDVILTSAVEGHGYVSIDGKRTYLNLFDTTDPTSAATTAVHPQATRTQAPPIVGTGYAIPQPDVTSVSPRPSGPPRRPTFHRRPTQPPVRIDTCIVGDTSTCDASQHEACATVQGVSACHCKPGYARLLHSLPCKRVVSIVVSIRVDRIYDWKVVWDHTMSDKDSESYQTIAYEANKAIESAMSMTPFSDEYMGSSINSVYQGDVSQGQGGVFVNATLKLTYEQRTARPSLAGELQRHLLGVIHRRNNNIGNSAVYVDSPPGSISNLQGQLVYPIQLSHPYPSCRNP